MDEEGQFEIFINLFDVIFTFFYFLLFLRKRMPEFGRIMPPGRFQFLYVLLLLFTIQRYGPCKRMGHVLTPSYSTVQLAKICLCTGLKLLKK